MLDHERRLPARLRLADDEITPRAGLVHRLLQSFVTKVAGFVCDNPRKLVALFGVIAAVMAGFAATLGDPDDVLANPSVSELAAKLCGSPVLKDAPTKPTLPVEASDVISDHPSTGESPRLSPTAYHQARAL